MVKPPEAFFSDDNYPNDLPEHAFEKLLFPGKAGSKKWCIKCGILFGRVQNFPLLLSKHS